MRQRGRGGLGVGPRPFAPGGVVVVRASEVLYTSIQLARGIESTDLCCASSRFINNATLFTHPRFKAAAAGAPLRMDSTREWGSTVLAGAMGEGVGVGSIFFTNTPV